MTMAPNTLPCCGLIPEMVRGSWEPHGPQEPCRPTARMALVHFDGCCFGNPGPYGGAAVVEGSDGRRHITTTQGEGTNNEAEYWGLIMGLRAAHARGYRIVEVRGDSQLVIRQMTGQYSVKHPRLTELHRTAQEAASKLQVVKYVWVPREQNSDADFHSRAAAKNHRKDLETLRAIR